MSTDMDREDVLSDFAMEPDLTSKILRAYIQRYPELALELTDLFHELSMVDLADAAGSNLEQEGIDDAMVGEGVAAVAAALSGSGLRDLARRLELPRDFIGGFRDARVRLGSVPSSVVLNLARAYRCEDPIFRGLPSTGARGHRQSDGIQGRYQSRKGRRYRSMSRFMSRALG